MSSTVILLMIVMTGIFLADLSIPRYSFEPLNYLLRVFFHGNLIHLTMNMITLWQLRRLSQLMSEKDFIKMLVFLWFFSSLFLYVINNVVPSTKSISIGFSGILFGMVLIMQFLYTKDLFNVSSGLILTIIPQLLIPQISFLGHLSGILAGILYVSTR